MFDEMKHETASFLELVTDTYPLGKNAIDALIAKSQEDTQTLRSLLPILETHLDESFADAFQIASYYFHLGENDKGFEWLERSRREGSLVRLKLDWDLDGVRDDPRYLGMLKRLGLD